MSSIVVIYQAGCTELMVGIRTTAFSNLTTVVSVIAGAWKDTTGVIQAMNEAKQTVTLSVDLFGRETPVEISFAEVRKI